MTVGDKVIINQRLAIIVAETEDKEWFKARFIDEAGGYIQFNPSE